MNTSNWIKDDYLAFALNYAAYVDGAISDEERDMIIEEVGGERAKKIQREGKKLSDYECLQILENERENHFPGEDGKKQLLDEISQLFNIDGNFSQLENVVIHQLNRLL